ncbi:hypothetical protein GH714_016484 [Hevea brasiliensis]|uniref:DUF4283 domain-containing protein n=1 Tax=Hevea brasiliensis TaxID=3981 RepID=A0A6A6NHT2_HEVBR|nr:hypothetical protein GH714_016484 [Hevea brasiliensis]
MALSPTQAMKQDFKSSRRHTVEEETELRGISVSFRQRGKPQNRLSSFTLKIKAIKDEFYGSLSIEHEEERGLNLDELEGDDSIEGAAIGNFIGRYGESDPNNFSGLWQNYMRIHVVIDVLVPMKRRMEWLRSDFPIVENNSESLGDDQWKQIWVVLICHLKVGIAYMVMVIRASQLFFERKEMELSVEGIWITWVLEGKFQMVKKVTRKLRMWFWVPGSPGAMSSLVWNCYELGNLQTVQALKDLVFNKQPRFIFLMETMVTREKVEIVQKALDFQGLFTVEPTGHREGHVEWRLTGFYGFLERHCHRESWDFLWRLKKNSTLLWCVVGDFNDILSHNENEAQVMANARRMLLQWQDAQFLSVLENNSATISQITRWLPPMSNRIKCNTITALDVNQERFNRRSANQTAHLLVRAPVSFSDEIE